LKLLLIRDGRIRIGLVRPPRWGIYFREPGGVLFEIATDSPGFDVDEPLLELGRSLKLPPWMEPFREAIEGSVARIQLPGANDPALAGR